MATNKTTIELINGVTLYRCWEDWPELEFMATFQYAAHAKEWAEIIVTQDEWRGSIIMVDHCDGSARQFTKPPETGGAADAD